MSASFVVNADDFGISCSINQAILWAMEVGAISSTTLMANMPGFDQACEMARRPALAGRVGVHINLVEGLPLTHSIRACRRFCGADGRFRGQAAKRLIRLTPEERTAVETEMEAQVQRCIDGGIRPTHLDSHHHFHTAWPIGAIAIKVARRRGIAAVRLTGDCRKLRSWARRFYVWFYNRRVKWAGLAKTDHFIGILDALGGVNVLDGIVEIMVHPAYDDQGEVVDLETGKQLEPLIRAIGVATLIPYPVR